jgi:hypothetical protein
MVRVGGTDGVEVVEVRFPEWAAGTHASRTARRLSKVVVWWSVVVVEMFKIQDVEGGVRVSLV